MKIDRRSFLSLGVGFGAGIALSPLPWKLTDDSSIWTQMWPWTPVPERGESRYVNSVCTLCPGGCGISVRKVEDRAVKIEGQKGHPVSNGGICLLGLSGLQLLYGPYRVKSPLKRRDDAKRGQGKWQKISWDEAIAEVAKKLGDAKDKTACIMDSDKGTVPQLFKTLLTGLGAPNFMRTPSIEDSFELALLKTCGYPAVAGFDLENADFVLSFGAGLLEGWGAPVRTFKANSLWKDKKVPVIQIEPRLSNTAAKSDKWIPVTPGTESELALGIAHVLIKEGLAKAEVSDSFKKIVSEGYAPDTVARLTGVEAGVIVGLAKSFAAASKPLALCGRGKGATPISLNETLAVYALNALMGNINKEGGLFAVPQPDYIRWAKTNSNASVAKLLYGKDTSLKALLVANANPLYSLPDTQAVKNALDKIPFIVSFSSYMDETAQYADLILPNHCYLERYEDVPAPAGYHKPLIGLSRPVVKPQFDTKHTGDAVIAIAKAMGAELPYDSYETCLKETFGDSWEAFQKDGVLVGANDYSPLPSAPSGKIELNETSLKPVALEGESSAFPLVLVPFDSMRLSGSSIGEPPFVIKTVDDTILFKNDLCIEINPKTAQSYNLSEGKYARLTTPKGSVKVRVHLYEGIMPGVIAMPRGLGHTPGFTGNDKYLAGKGVNVNELMGSAECPDGLNAAYGIRAKLERA